SEIIDKSLITDRIRVGLNRAAAGTIMFIGREYAQMVELERELKDEGKVDVGTTGRTRAQAGAD
ncbi:penicillin-binding protein activator LpoB, partial [Shewanella sp. A25]|nr:penicillin-binding protein activator LpoB [Shewanella shenzhenensis]